MSSPTPSRLGAIKGSTISQVEPLNRWRKLMLANTEAVMSSVASHTKPKNLNVFR